jgi:hypothetical protein
MATTVTTIAPSRRLHSLGALLSGRRQITRRDLQIALGVLWLLDGVLQAQPFMFTRDFATQVIGGVGQGQPGFVSAPIHWVSTIIAAHPAAWNVPFAGVQLLLGAGLLVRRTARLALAASIAWALGVWYLGEGFAGMASGHASMISGAPGSASIYAVLAAAAWPHWDSSREAPALWLPIAWAVVWVGSAVFQAVPGQNTGGDVAGELTAGSAPGWLGSLDNSAATWATQHGVLLVSLLVAAMAIIGIGALARATMTTAVVCGLGLTLAIWVLGQNLCMIYTGQATDPNTGPVLALMGIALLAGPREIALPARPAWWGESS